MNNGARILVVEDQQIVARDLRLTLETMGYSVPAVVGSGEEAIEQTAALRPDLVLMDIVLQGDLDGIEAAKQVRQRFGIPVVFLTAYSERATIERAKHAEPLGYIIKPFDEREIRTTVEIALYRQRMERQLRASEQKLSAILMSIDNGVIATDADSAIMFMNPIAERLTGWPSRTASGLLLRDVLRIRHERGPDLFDDPLKVLLHGCRLVDLSDHLFLVAKHGKEFPIECGISTMENDDGGIAGYVVAFRDVTDRKTVTDRLHQSLEELTAQEEALRGSFEELTLRNEELSLARNAIAAERQRYRDLFEFAPDGYVVTDDRARIIDANSSAVQLLGRSKDEIMGGLLVQFVAPGSRREFARSVSRLVQDGVEKISEWNAQLLRGSAERFDAEITVGALRGSQRSPIALRWLIRDITDRRQAEEERERILHELSQKNTELDALIRVTTSAISTLDLAKLHDSVLTSLVGTMNADIAIIWLREDDRLMVRAGINARHEGGIGFVLPMGEGIVGEVAVTRKSVYLADSGSDKRVRNPYLLKRKYKTMVTVPMVHNDQVIGVLQVGWRSRRHDDPRVTRLLEITAERCAMAIVNAQLFEQTKRFQEELEQRVAERTEQLAISNRELEAFSYSVSHDLRAPLRAINGFAGALLEDHADRLDDEGRHFLNIIRTNTQMMGKLIDELLAFSRFGRREVTTAPIDMRHLAQSVVDEARRTEQERNVEVVINDLPLLDGDSLMIRQVLLNLVSNSFKFTRNRPDARVVIGSYTTDSEMVYFVRDNGVGFDMRYSNKLFGVFQRLHPTDHYEGTGVGLAIVQRIVNRHGGRVWAEGKINEGATFYFSFPLHRTPGAPAGVDSDP